LVLNVNTDMPFPTVEQSPFGPHLGKPPNLPPCWTFILARLTPGCVPVQPSWDG